MAERTVSLGVIGGGLMGRELASAVARWIHLENLGVTPRLVHVCDIEPQTLAWYERLADSPRLSSDPAALLADPEVEAVYIAVPHNLHAELYVEALEAGKHLLGEKPFGIDREANERIMARGGRPPRPGGALLVGDAVLSRRPGGVALDRGRALRPPDRGPLAVPSLSDLDPEKPINWKRRAETNGAYGCLGDLGMHALHVPLRAGWAPLDVRALLGDIVKERPDGHGARRSTRPTTRSCSAAPITPARSSPLRIETKRIAPGETNTWVIEVDGTEGSIAFTTKRPKTLRTMSYERGGPQAWQEIDLGSQSA